MCMLQHPIYEEENSTNEATNESVLTSKPSEIIATTSVTPSKASSSINISRSPLPISPATSSAHKP